MSEGEDTSFNSPPFPNTCEAEAQCKNSPDYRVILREIGEHDIVFGLCKEHMKALVESCIRDDDFEELFVINIKRAREEDEFGAPLGEVDDHKQ